MESHIVHVEKIGDVKYTPGSRICDLKNIIQTKYGISSENLILHTDNKILDDHYQLDMIGCSIIYLDKKGDENHEFIISIPDRTKYTVKAARISPLRIIKEKFEEMTGYPADDQIYYFFQHEIPDTDMVFEFPLNVRFASHYTNVSVKYQEKILVIPISDGRALFSDVKKGIESQLGIVPGSQKLFRERATEDMFFSENCLSNCKIATVLRNPSEIINLTVVPYFQSTKLCVKTLTGKDLVLDSGSDFSIKQIKLQIEKIEDCPSEMLRLIFAGKQVDDEGTMADYNIPEESTLHMVLRLRGC